MRPVRLEIQGFTCYRENRKSISAGSDFSRSRVPREPENPAFSTPSRSPSMERSREWVDKTWMNSSRSEPHAPLSFSNSTFRTNDFELLVHCLEAALRKSNSNRSQTVRKGRWRTEWERSIQGYRPCSGLNTKRSYSRCFFRRGNSRGS